MIIEAEPDMEVAGEAEDGLSAISGVTDLQPDVVLMDIQMPAMDGLEATRRILDSENRTNTRVLILTTFERDEYIFKALSLGASGFILKNAPPEDLITAIRTVAEGNALLAPSVTRRVIAEFTRQPVFDSRKDELERLTEREIEVLRLVARGQSNAEIADQLVVGEATVKTHVSNMLTKLGLRDRVQAVVFAYEIGLVQPRW
jgi:DNA-binding NarL/FixJ family response regulator